MDSLGAQIAAMTGATEALGEAARRANACRDSLGDVRLETLAADLKALGADATAGSRQVEGQRTIVNDAVNARTLADERARHAGLALEAAVGARDAALVAFPEGVDAALVTARAAVAAGTAEREEVAAEFAWSK
jgi:hypothetical protein